MAVPLDRGKSLSFVLSLSFDLSGYSALSKGQGELKGRSLSETFNLLESCVRVFACSKCALFQVCVFGVGGWCAFSSVSFRFRLFDFGIQVMQARDLVSN